MPLTDSVPLLSFFFFVIPKKVVPEWLTWYLFLLSWQFIKLIVTDFLELS